MRYRVYGVDAASQQAREPLVVEAGSEDEARGRAVAQGMAVRAVIAEPAPMPVENGDSEPPAPEAETPTPAPADEMAAVRRVILLVLLPIVVAFFLAVAIVRTLWQAATWSAIWLAGVLLGGGVAGLVAWLSRGAAPIEIAWPIGLSVALTAVSALYGSRAGWRWWWAKRSLNPLAQVLGLPPDASNPGERPASIRMPVILAQALAGALLGTIGGWTGWATDWSFFSIAAWTGGGALGLAVEGAFLGAVLSWRRPMPVPEAQADHSLAGLLTGFGGDPRVSRLWILGYAFDRAVPGAVAGTFVGLGAVLLGHVM